MDINSIRSHLHPPHLRGHQRIDSDVKSHRSDKKQECHIHSDKTKTQSEALIFVVIITKLHVGYTRGIVRSRLMNEIILIELRFIYQIHNNFDNNDT